MQAHAIHSSGVGVAQQGWILAHEVRSLEGRRLFRKGTVLGPEELSQWGAVEPGTVHLIELQPGDVHEDEAGKRIARAVAGEGLELRGPIQSRYNLVANRKGLLRVDADLLRRINRVEGVTVFTLLDRQTVLPCKVVAGVKVTPISLRADRVTDVEDLTAQSTAAVVSVLAFQPKRVFVVATEGLSESLRGRFREMVTKKIGWYGSSVIDVRFVENDPTGVEAAFREGMALGADVLMAAGGNTIDPLDSIFLALPRLGGQMVHFGAPAHPGSMFWLARIGDVPVFNLASCSMYSQATVADLILPLVMTGQSVESDDIIELGYGGLLERDMRFRFPDYDAEQSDEDES
jgi:hypothetical protein